MSENNILSKISIIFIIFVLIGFLAIILIPIAVAAPETLPIVLGVFVPIISIAIIVIVVVFKFTPDFLKGFMQPPNKQFKQKKVVQLNKKDKKEIMDSQYQPDEQILICPYCGYEIKQNAKICPYCKSNL
ncbi:MAG: zinc ribbon domain-containing protein [Promethearchaeota archaeon]